MIVLPPQDVDMEGGARGDGEGVEDVGDHLRGELADLFALEPELGDAVGARANVDDGSGECLQWGAVGYGSVRHLFVGMGKETEGKE